MSEPVYVALVFDTHCFVSPTVFFSAAVSTYSVMRHADKASLTPSTTPWVYGSARPALSRSGFFLYRSSHAYNTEVRH